MLTTSTVGEFDSDWWFTFTVALLGACTICMCLKFARKQDPRSDLQAMEYIPWAKLDELNAQMLAQIVVVDCTHPSVSVNLTHHRQPKALPRSLRGDASTDVVLNALELKDPLLCRGKQYVSCNHFDIDGYLSVMAALKPKLALQYNSLFRRAARIGDFRELVVDEQGTLGGQEEEARALELCCWINALEMQRFWRPFDKNEGDPSESLHDVDKWAYFLSPAVLKAFKAVIRGEDINAMPSDDDATNRAHTKSWQAERDTVHRDSMLVANSSITRVPDVGLVVVGPLLQPVHYYALFSATIGADVLLTLVTAPNGGLVAEIEQKYTTFVDFASRPTLPRVDVLPLTSLLNALEAKHGRSPNAAAGSPEAHPEAVWVGERFVDSGPLLRLEWRDQPLTKAARYGHPSERYASLMPSRSSLHAGEIAAAPSGNNGAAAAKVDADHVPTTRIPRNVLVAAVEGYLRAAYGKQVYTTTDSGSDKKDRGSSSERAPEPPTEPRLGWSWKEIREFNAKVAGPRVRAWLWNEHQLQFQEDKYKGEYETERAAE